MDLRRTAVTEMMEGGVDLAGIMQVTGHQNAASVKPYMVNTFSGASKALSARQIERNKREARMFHNSRSKGPRRVKNEDA